MPMPRMLRKNPTANPYTGSYPLFFATREHTMPVTIQTTRIGTDNSDSIGAPFPRSPRLTLLSRTTTSGTLYLATSVTAWTIDRNNHHLDFSARPMTSSAGDRPGTITSWAIHFLARPLSVVNCTLSVGRGQCSPHSSRQCGLLARPAPRAPALCDVSKMPERPSSGRKSQLRTQVALCSRIRCDRRPGSPAHRPHSLLDERAVPVHPARLAPQR